MAFDGCTAVLEEDVKLEHRCMFLELAFINSTEVAGQPVFGIWVIA